MEFFHAGAKETGSFTWMVLPYFHVAASLNSMDKLFLSSFTPICGARGI